MCDYIKPDGTKCGNKGRCPHHDKLTKKDPIQLAKRDPAQKSPDFLRSAAASALGNVFGRIICAAAILIFAVVSPDAYRTLQSLNSPLPPSSPVGIDASNRAQTASEAEAKLEPRQVAASPVPLCCPTTVGSDTPASAIVTSSAILGAPSPSLQENLSHSDSVTEVLNGAVPTAIGIANGIEPNAVVVLPSALLQGIPSNSAAMAVIGKTTPEPAILALIGGQSTQSSFDPSKIAASLSMENSSATNAGFPRDAIAQVASLQVPSSNWPPNGVISSNALQSIPNPVTDSTGIPIVAPAAFQTSPTITGTNHPITLPTSPQ